MRTSPLYLGVVVLFCLPLFFGLGRTDFGNDEALYAYAVDRMLETGDWRTPQASPGTQPAFDKPPLMMWLAAAGIRLGVLPHDEAGIRFWPALFGALALVYVFLLGRRLAHPIAGLGAVFLLVAQPPFLFDHGLRSFGMDAGLVLAYCGGIYHFLVWAEADGEPARRRQAFFSCTWIGFGLLTKFVAVFFLPLVLACCAVAFPEWRRRLREDLGRWVAALALTAVWVTPWFALQTIEHGADFWKQMLGVMVVQRLTGTLVPGHLHPWHHYATGLVESWRLAGVLVWALAGIALWTFETVRRRWRAGFVVLAWLFLPLALMSAMTSKLLHYAHPLLPAAALMAAYPLALVVRWAERSREAPGSEPRRWPASPAARGALLGIGVLLAVAVSWRTGTLGPFQWVSHGVVVFQSTSVIRPLLVAASALSFFFGRRELAPALLLATLLPLGRYEGILRHCGEWRQPMRRSAECVAMLGPRVRLPDGETGSLLYVHVPGGFPSHDWFYYFRRLDVVQRRAVPLPEMLYPRLFVPGHQAPTAIPEADYLAFLRHLDDPELPRRLAKLAHRTPLRVRELPEPLTAVKPARGVGLTAAALLLPGPYEVCLPHAVAEGAVELAIPPDLSLSEGPPRSDPAPAGGDSS